MEQIIWVEILSRHGDVAARHRCTGRGVRIGRAYTNDVILDDPAVAPEHLHVVYDDAGALVAEDLGSANGLYAGHDRRRVARILLDGNRTIRVGSTLIRVRGAGHAVAPDQVVKPPARRWPALLALAIAALILELGSLWLSDTGEFEPSRYLLPALGVTGAALGWAALWSVLARVFGREARFERNLIIVLSGLLAGEIYYEIGGVAAFAFSWPFLSAYLYVGLWCILGTVCFLHLRVVGSSRLGLKGGAVAALVVIAVGAQIVTQSGWRSGFDQRDHVRRLLPATLRLTPLKSEDAFFAGVAQLKSKVDRARNEDGR